MEKKKSNFIKDKIEPPTFILFLLIFVLLVLYLIYEIGLDFKPVAVIEYEGYAVSGQDIVENLLRSDLNGEKHIEPIKIEENSVIYKKIATYFIGEEMKEKINLDYPIYINNNAALLNMTDDIILITSEFEQVEGYKDSALTDGGLYNTSGFERADYNDYLFIKNSDNIYINSKEIKITTTANSYIIPKNSIINFTEEYISYYHMENEVFKYETIIDINNDSELVIESFEYKFDFENGKVDAISNKTECLYKEFLIKLNIIKENNNIKNEEKEEIDDKEEQDNKDDKEEIKDDNINKEEPDKGEEPEFVWIKPEVKASELIPNIYTASTNLYIYDPSGVIKTAIVFEVYKDGKVYMRNQAISSGLLRLGVLEPNTEYEIKGKYQYLTEDKKTIEVQFIDQTIKTKDFSETKTLKLSFENKNIYENKIEISNLKLDCDFNEVNETLVGVKRAELIVNNKVYSIMTTDLRRILSGQKVDIQSKENLQSNTKYKYEIKFYDVSDNLVKLENNFGQSNTCMQRPEIIISNASNKARINISLKLEYKNKDDVEISNKKYIVYSVDNKVIDEGNITSNIITPANLELGKFYTIKTYGDFDLKDNNGLRTGELLGESTFSTAKLKDFGDLYIDTNLNSDDIKTDSIILDLSINATTNKTNIELIGMLKNAKIILLQEDEVFLEKYLSDEEFNIFKNLGTVSVLIDKLNSNSRYQIEIEALAEAGKTKETLKSVVSGTKRFNTLKEEAVISIKNLFILKDTIDFDINIYDIDGAIRDTNVVLEINSTRNETVARKEIKPSKIHNEYTRIQIQDLVEEEKYYFSLFVTRYSTKESETTLAPKYFEFNGNEKRIENSSIDGKNLGIICTNKVGGDLILKSVKRELNDGTGNLIDANSDINWYSECFNTTKGYLKEYDKDSKILKLGVGNSTSATTSQYYLFDLLTSYTEYKNEGLEVSFKYKKSDDNLNIYLQNGVNKNVCEINDGNTEEDIDGSDWRVFDSTKKDKIDQVIDTDKYIGFLLEGPKNSFVEIKELQVKLKPSEEDVEENPEVDPEQELIYKDYEYKLNSKFVLNLNLYNEELEKFGYDPNVTNGKYFVRIKNNTDNQVNDIEYNNYQDIVKTENYIENYMFNLDLLENKQYEIMLILKNPEMMEREYILSSIDVDTTNKEIKDISTIQEYLKIQPNGSYIISNNLNLGTGDYKFGNENLEFNGLIDFNGNTITRKIIYKENDENYKYYLFYALSENAKIKNLNFDFSIDLKVTGEFGNINTDIGISEKNSGLVYENKGTISDIIVNLNSCTKSPVKEFAIIGYENKGTLENFVIYLKSNFYLGGTGALGFVNCTNGIIKNGYITQYPKTTYTIKPIKCNGVNRINIAGLVGKVINGSEISNVYSLVTIDNKDENTGNDAPFFAGNLISTIKESNVRNVYSVGIGNITKDNSKYNNIEAAVGPTIAYPYNVEDKNDIQNSYFFYNESINNNEYNTKVNIAALSNEEFQANLLNSEESEKQFIIDTNIKNYFPKVKLSAVMPKQLNIPMIKAEEVDADIIGIKVLKDGDTEKLTEITLFNPQETKINKIELDGLELDKYRIHNNDYCSVDSIFEKCKGADKDGYCLDELGNRILVSEDGYTQKYLSGQTSKIIAKVSIPKNVTLDGNGFDNREYKSKYYVKTIGAQGYVDKIYIDNGDIKIINEVSLIYYYQISDINKWKRINEYPEQNYRIVSDLDFSNRNISEYCITKAFTGILDGKYTNESGTFIANLNNIGQVGAEIKEPLLYKIDGANISNLMINEYIQLLDTKNTTNNKYMGGLIGITTKGTKIENVHMNGVKITTKANKNNADNFCIGGLITDAKETIIRNCSVTYKKETIKIDNRDELIPNMRDINQYELSKVTIGGLISYGQKLEISNCFTKDLYIDIKVDESNGIGGIVGNYTGKIYNCYSIGEIKTNTSKIGGIFGEGLELSLNNVMVYANCENCYALVNIKTEGTDLGGIGGITSSNSKKLVVNNISFGNLYTSRVGNNINLNRIIGNDSSATYTNYGYAKQLINGFKTNSKLGAKYVYEKTDFTNNMNGVFDTDVYNIQDLKEGEEGYLPRLKYINSNELLPNQSDIDRRMFPKNPTLEIISATEESGKIVVKIKDENDEPVDTRDISIGIANFSGVNIDPTSINFNETTNTHTITLTGTPIYYLDSYEINKIMYKDKTGQDFSAEIAVKIEYVQYKEISSIEDWAAEFCTAYSGYRYSKNEGVDGKPVFLKKQNYKITENIDLKQIKDVMGLSIPVNLEIGRLVGDEDKPTISLSLDEQYKLNFKAANSGIFRSISNELKNLNFENIVINNTSGSYTGIISKCTAQQIENLSFSNIKITGKSNYVGIISHNTCTNIKDITLNNITCNGTTYVGGFMGYSYPGIIQNINANQINVTATTSYIGGIIGYVVNTTAYTTNLKNFNISDAYIKTTGSGNYIGGLVGYNYARSAGSEYTLKNIKIECTGAGNNVGGAFGYKNAAISNIYVYGINITTNGTSNIGGIAGNCNSNITNGYIEGYIDGENIYNCINAPKASSVGGVCGYLSGTLQKILAKNLSIIGKKNIGGITGGIIVSSGNSINIISQDNTIKGNENVGGILGGLTTDKYSRGTVLNLNNSYTNSKVEATVKNAGGIVGYIDNSKMTNKNYISKIYYNQVACSEIIAPENAGSLIGFIQKPIYYLNKNSTYYYGNLIISNIEEEKPIGNIDNLTETFTNIVTTTDPETGETITKEELITRIVPRAETISRLFTSKFYKYEVEGTDKVLETSKLAELKLAQTYKDVFGNSNSNYSYSNIEIYFPMLTNVKDVSKVFNDGSSYTYVQTRIELPKEATQTMSLNNSITTFSLNNYLKESLPNYEIYVSDVDKINIEFDKTSSNAYFKFEDINGNVSEKIPILERTYTLKYDFVSEFKLTIGNDQYDQEEIIMPKDIVKRVSVSNGNYYYLQGNTLKVNTNTINGKFKNLFNQNALTTDGYIYNLVDNSKGKEKIEGLYLLKNSIPLKETVYSDSIIETYYNYSKIIDQEEKISNYQIFVKNNKLFMLDGNLDIHADSIIIDAYNNKEYQTALGKDGIIYNFKDEIKYPENFVNEKILQMTNNIYEDTDILLVMYEDGRIYVFNYRTGNVIFDSDNEQVEVNSSLINMITSLFEESDETLYELNKEEYQEAVRLQEKLTQTPIEEAQEIINEQLDVDSNETEHNTGASEKENGNSNSNQSNGNETINDNENSNSGNTDYVTVYDANSNQYLVYKADDLLGDNSKKEKVVSETEKIYSTPALREYYNTANTENYRENSKGIYLVAISITLVLGILVVMYKKKNY